MKTVLKIVLALLIIGSFVLIFLGISAYAEERLDPVVFGEQEWREVGTCTITHYCSCSKCCGKWGNVTKTGTKPQRYVTVSVDPKVIPLGSLIYIDEYGYRIAEDTGSAIKGKRIDVYTDTHEHALELGKQKQRVWIVKEAK